jgi:DNA polymerase-1
MPVIHTGSLTPDSIARLSEAERLQVYNGLDCGVTLEVWEELRKQFPHIPAIYSFERALQAPYLEIMQRGFRVDQLARERAAKELRLRREQLERMLNELAQAVWEKGLNPRSPQQLKDFFFRAMRLPEVWLSQKGERKLSTNREALEKLEVYLHARPFVSLILAIRDIGKQLDVFESEIDPDGRFRTSYNIAGTETGRPSSSTNAFGTGGNAQNIAASLRHVFIADPGYKLAVVDLEQVEARDVGFFCGCLFNEWRFLNACESGDLHTNNAKLIWPELGWTEDRKFNRSLADQRFYREFTYRDMAKRGGHLSNYGGSAWTMARSLKIPQELAEEFQARYVRGRYGHPTKPDLEPAYPEIHRWWQWVAEQLQTTSLLVTPFGRRRHFFGRPGDETTLREAIAFLPQSTTADRMNLGLWRVWKKEPGCQLLAQTYDSITFQALDDSHFDDLVGRVLEHIRVELFAPSGRRYWVPGEAKVGWNWGYRTEDKRTGQVTNPEGLVKWVPGGDKRRRVYGLQQIMR